MTEFKPGDQVEASMYAGGGYLTDVRDGVVVSAGPNLGLDGEPYSYSVYVQFENPDGEKWVTDFEPGQLKRRRTS